MRTFRDSDVVEQARGVIAARLEVDPETAGNILARVAKREGLSREELAADVIASCTRSRVSLRPRSVLERLRP